MSKRDIQNTFNKHLVNCKSRGIQRKTKISNKKKQAELSSKKIITRKNDIMTLKMEKNIHKFYYF